MRARIVSVLVVVTVCLASGEKAASDLAADVLHFAYPFVAHVEGKLQLTVVTGAELSEIGRANRARGHSDQNFILPGFGLGDIDHT